MSETVSGEELEKINGYAREPLTEDKVFVFRVALCDNDIDRDGEKFSSGALEKLAELFKGRTGIFDHDPKSSKQTARIFDTWVETLPEKTTTDGEVYRRLMAKAYMVRTASNGDLISEIQGGIKKEVSVSCTMGKKLCSVCGADMYKGGCDHEKGGEYGGKLCYHILDEPLDAYEWSFVAVPAQVNAGVTKRFALREKHEGTDKSYELALAREAFEKDVLRLSYFCKPFMSAKRVKELAELMTVTELIDFRGRLEKQAAENEEVCKAERESFITGDYIDSIIDRAALYYRAHIKGLINQQVCYAQAARGIDSHLSGSIKLRIQVDHQNFLSVFSGQNIRNHQGRSCFTNAAFCIDNRNSSHISALL